LQEDLQGSAPQTEDNGSRNHRSGRRKGLGPERRSIVAALHRRDENHTRPTTTPDLMVMSRGMEPESSGTSEGSTPLIPPERCKSEQFLVCVSQSQN